MRFTPMLLAASAALALAACAQTAEDTTEADSAATTATNSDAATADAAAGTDAAAPADAQGFVNAAAASDMFEIQAGKLAKEKGASQAVKEFGAMMEREHTKSRADLKAAAGEAGVTPAPQMTAKQQSDLAALQGATEQFDSLFKTQQLAAHTEALALLRAQADGGAAAPLKAFAAKTAPVVEKHLAQARNLP